MKTINLSILCIIFILSCKITEETEETSSPPTITEVTRIGPAENLSIKEIKCLQVVEGADLISQKATVVRVMLETNEIIEANITGFLKVLNGNTVIHPRIIPIGPIPLVSNPRWGSEVHTLNFEIPAPTNIPVSDQIFFEIELFQSIPGEQPTTLHTGNYGPFEFKAPINPHIVYVPIKFNNQLPDEDLIRPGVGDVFLKSLFPVNEADASIYMKEPNGKIVDFVGNGDNTISFEEMDEDIFKKLSIIKEFLVDDGRAAEINTVMYGFVKGNPVDSNGYASKDGLMAVGNTEIQRYQRTMAHEIGHLYGQEHNDLGTGLGWNVQNTLNNSPAGYNITNQRLKPAVLNDLMVPGKLTSDAWISPTTFNGLRARHLPRLPIILILMDSLNIPPTPFLPEVAVIQGVLNKSGRSVKSLDPVFRYPWLSQPTMSKKDRYKVIIKTKQNEYTGYFSGEVIPDGQTKESRYGFFKVRIPVKPNEMIVSLSIIDTETSKEIASRKSKGRAILTDFQVEEIKRQGILTSLNLNWNIRKLPERNTVFHLVYGSPKRNDWQPIKFDLVASKGKYTFPKQEIVPIKKTEGSGYGVFISDGLNTYFQGVRIKK